MAQGNSGAEGMPFSSAELIEDPVGRYPQATVACFDPTRGNLPRRHLDEARTVAMLGHLAAAGVEAVLIASSTGQGHLRNHRELVDWLRCAARARLGATLPIALLRPEDGTQANARLIAQLPELGYPVVFFRPGNDLPPAAGDAAVVAQLAPLVASAADQGLAIGLYTVPDVSGLPLTPAAAAQLVAGPGGGHIVAIKITEVDYAQSTAQFLAHPDLQRLKIVQGWDPHLARALREGGPRAGITSGLMALALYQYQYILGCADRADWDALTVAQAAVNTLFRAMQDDPQHFSELQRAKYLMGLGHPLTGTVSEGQVERILETLRALPRAADRQRIARSLDLMGDGPCHAALRTLYAA